MRFVRETVSPVCAGSENAGAAAYTAGAGPRVFKLQPAARARSAAPTRKRRREARWGAGMEGNIRG